MVGLDNPLHIAIVLVVVLLVFGAKRLPEMGKSLGEGLRGFKESVSGEPRSARADAADPERRQLPAAPVALQAGALQAVAAQAVPQPVAPQAVAPQAVAPQAVAPTSVAEHAPAGTQAVAEHAPARPAA